MSSIDSGSKRLCSRCDSATDLLRVVSKIFTAMAEGDNIQQAIAEELTSIMSLERCVVFRIMNRPSGPICQIIAGTPAGGHRIEDKPESLSNHPDLEQVFATRRSLHVRNPRDNRFTQYFFEIIEDREIAEILYLPLVIRCEVKGVIVLDAVGERSFSEADIFLSSCIADLVSVTLGREDELRQKWRDIIFNQLVPQGGLAGQVVRLSGEIDTAAKKLEEVSRRILEASLNIEGAINKDEIGL